MVRFDVLEDAKLIIKKLWLKIIMTLVLLVIILVVVFYVVSTFRKISVQMKSIGKTGILEHIMVR